MHKTGLTSAQVKEKISRGEQNIPFVAPSKTEKQIIKENIFTRFNALNALLAFFVLLVSLSNPKNLVNLAFMGLVIVNTAIGIIQEIRAKRTVDKLSIITEPHIDVLRDGQRQTIRSAEIVIDDLLILNAGKQVPVDGIFVEGEGFEINEALLTGEADAVRKNPGDPVYSGSFVIAGEAFVRVCKVSADTYAASISKEIKENKRKNSQIVLALNDIIRILSFLIIPIGILLFIGKFFIVKENISLSHVVISTVAALVGMIPEGLMLMTSIAFAVSVVVLGRKKTLVQTLSSIETLARVDTICLDKTGTITSGEMECAQFFPCWEGLGSEGLGSEVSEKGIPCQRPDLNQGLPCQLNVLREYFSKQGSEASFDLTRLQALIACQKELNPTQNALNLAFLDAASKDRLNDNSLNDEGNDKLLNDERQGLKDLVVRTIPFQSQRKWLGVCFKDGTTQVLGAPEFILQYRPDLLAMLQPRISSETSKGYRLLLWAHLPLHLAEDNCLNSHAAKEIQPLALISIADQIRPQAKALFDYFQEQKVQIKLISGDHPNTVAALAKRANLTDLGDAFDMSRLTRVQAESIGMSWRIKNEASAETEAVDFDQVVRQHHVFGRVTPEQKRLLLQALQRQGHIVAMTGDGVNDVLALKDADCGIAMASGSDAARAVSDMVLLDNNLENIVTAVYEGRRVINNIERVATLFLVKTIYSFLLALTYILLPTPFPIFPIQITMLASLTIGIPSFFLALKPNKDRVTGRFIEKVFFRCVPGGVTAALLVLFMQLIGSLCHLSPNEISCLCATALAVSGFYMLWQVCRPWDLSRKMLWAFCVSAFFLEILFLPNLFRMKPLHDSKIWPFLFILVLYFPLYRYFEQFFHSHHGRRLRDKAKKLTHVFKTKYLAKWLRCFLSR